MYTETRPKNETFVLTHEDASLSEGAIDTLDVTAKLKKDWNEIGEKTLQREEFSFSYDDGTFELDECEGGLYDGSDLELLAFVYRAVESIYDARVERQIDQIL